MGTTAKILGIAMVALVGGNASADQKHWEREPFQFTARADWEEGSRSMSESFQVPSGKRLVIEHVSASIEVPLEQEIIGTLVATVAGGERAHHYFFIPRAGTFDPDVDNLSPGDERTGPEGNELSIYVGSAHVKLYADPGTAVDLGVVRSDWLCPFTCGAAIVVVSGYLMDARPPRRGP